MEWVIQNGNVAIGHSGVTGAVTGTITCSSKVKINGLVDCSRTDDIIYFPSHPHAFDANGNPINYRSHSIHAIGTSKIKIGGKRVCKHNDVVNVADEAGGNAYLQATQSKLKSN